MFVHGQCALLLVEVTPLFAAAWINAPGNIARARDWSRSERLRAVADSKNQRTEQKRQPRHDE
jgi:hypothetical protein